MLIAQISDTHLRADNSLMHGRIDTRRALADAVAHINALDPRPDIVLATGDLVDRAQPGDYPLLRSMLDGLQMPVFVIPGNHDEREMMRGAFCDQGYLPSEGTFLHYAIEDHPIRLIGLDTQRPGEVRGGLCRARLAWLRDRLDECPDRPTLVFMHHPPFASGIVFLDRPAFEGAEDMAAIIADRPHVRQVICGHIHRVIYLNWAGTCAAVAPSTVYQMNLTFKPDVSFQLTDDPPAIALYRWRDGLGPVGYVSQIIRRKPERDS
ncbi:MAG: phosphodiesterase [Rhodospirillales bacterium]|nr:phosphodiesterase [Rhodospirillales bacterium]